MADQVIIDDGGSTRIKQRVSVAGNGHMDSLLEVTAPGAEGAVGARVVSEETLGDEVIYVVETGGVDLRVRRLAEV